MISMHEPPPPPPPPPPPSSSHSFLLPAMAAAATAAAIATLHFLHFLCPPVSACHSTTIVKQMGSPYSAEESEDIANLVAALPPQCVGGELPEPSPSTETPGKCFNLNLNNFKTDFKLKA